MVITLPSSAKTITIPGRLIQFSYTSQIKNAWRYKLRFRSNGKPTFA